MELLLQAQGGDDLTHVSLVHLPAVQLDGQDDVLPHGEHRHQIVALEHKADLPAAEDGALPLFHGKQISPVQQHLAGGRGVQPAQQIEQSALAGTALAHHGHKFALGHREAHVLQRLHGSLAGAVGLAKGLCLQQIHTKTFFRFDLSTAYHPFATAR